MIAAQVLLLGVVDEVKTREGAWAQKRVCVLPCGVVTGAHVQAALESDLVMWSLDLWRKFREFGLPHGGGWAHERPLTIRVLQLWEEARAAVETQRLQQR